MLKQLTLVLGAGVVLSACSGDSAPTGQGEWGNLLEEQSDQGNLGSSKFDLELLTIVDPVDPKEPELPWEPTWLPPDARDGFTHITEGEDKTKYFPDGHTHVAEGADKTKYIPPGFVHLEGAAGDEDNTKYVPPGWEHSTKNYDKTKYHPEGWIHQSLHSQPDRTKYYPKGYEHIPEGENKSKYQSPGHDGTDGAGE